MTNAAPTSFDIIVADGFVLTEMAGVMDVLRIANRISSRKVFAWRYVSLRGGPVKSSGDAIVQTEPLQSLPDAQYAFVLGNPDPDHPDLSMSAEVSKYTARQARVILLSEAASRFIADRRDAESRHTTHWENRAVLQESMGLIDTNSALAVEEGSVVTCAGMGATIDVTLAIAASHLSSAAMMTVADIMLHERIRHFNTLQPFSGRDALATGDADLDVCVSLMHANIEFPIPISEIAAQSGLSKRSLERKFNRVLHSTPNNYYRELRLNKANNLLLNTSMSINEIGLACGFPSGFTGVYKQVFGMTPNAARRKTHKE